MDVDEAAAVVRGQEAEARRRLRSLLDEHADTASDLFDELAPWTDARFGLMTLSERWRRVHDGEQLPPDQAADAVTVMCQLLRDFHQYCLDTDESQPPLTSLPGHPIVHP